jgi:hypothetical protein
MSDLTRVVIGESIRIHRLASLLEENGIACLIKDAQESARIAGFGALNNSVELFVNHVNAEQAQKIIEEFENAGG